MQLAKHAGINAANARIVDSDGIAVTVITRFDRALKLPEKTGPAASIEVAMSVIPYFRISLKRAYELLDPIARAISRWQEERRSLGMTNSDLEQFSQSFEHPEQIAVREVLA